MWFSDIKCDIVLGENIYLITMFKIVTKPFRPMSISPVIVTIQHDKSLILARFVIELNQAAQSNVSFLRLDLVALNPPIPPFQNSLSARFAVNDKLPVASILGNSHHVPLRPRPRYPDHASKLWRNLAPREIPLRFQRSRKIRRKDPGSGTNERIEEGGFGRSIGKFEHVDGPTFRADGKEFSLRVKRQTMNPRGDGTPSQFP